ncbi:glycosyltransferase family 2 protein [Providencia huaxiensis]|uniref:Glycosyltransferase family 2 protein n=1 Tax=Providencia rettgeri TaxID=587 RepID=A0AAD2VS04_PRORE|nr:glycosyltransferase family 2 protein [Providencia rettgeri]
MKEKKINSITITYEPDIDILRNQIMSLSSQVCSVIIVDNNSNNISKIKDICNELNNCTLIPLDDNYGIAYAQNKGIELSVKNSATHVILFDQDSNIELDFINGLLKAENELLDNGESVAAVGPAFYDQESGYQYKNTYVKNTPILKGLFLGKNEFTNGLNHLESYFLIASGCLIRTSIIKEIGLMDSTLFIDNVDSEWCFRAQYNGYKVFTTNYSLMSHNIGEGKVSVFGKKIAVHSNIRKYYNTRNNLYLMRLSYVKNGTKIRVIPFLVAKFIIGLKTTNNVKEYIRYHFLAIYDFLKNKKGKFNH